MKLWFHVNALWDYYESSKYGKLVSGNLICDKGFVTKSARASALPQTIHW